MWAIGSCASICLKRNQSYSIAPTAELSSLSSCLYCQPEYNLQVYISPNGSCENVSWVFPHHLIHSLYSCFAHYLTSYFPLPSLTPSPPFLSYFGPLFFQPRFNVCFALILSPSPSSPSSSPPPSPL